MNNDYKLFEQLEEDVVDWGVGKNILGPDKKTTEQRVAQWGKMNEEVQEVREAIDDEDRGALILELGDVLVTACVQANLWNTSLYECLGAAYSKISKRTGRTIDGVFVKDE